MEYPPVTVGPKNLDQMHPDYLAVDGIIRHLVHEGFLGVEFSRPLQDYHYARYLPDATWIEKEQLPFDQRRFQPITARFAIDGGIAISDEIRNVPADSSAVRYGKAIYIVDG